MKKKLSKGFLLMSSLLIGFLPQVKAQGDVTLQPLDKIIAKVNDFIILNSELEQSALQFSMNGRYVDEKTKCKLFETLVINKMMIAKAEMDSVTVEPGMVEQQVNNRLESVMRQNQWDEEDVRKNMGKTIDELRDEYFPYIEEQMILERMQGQITSGITVTPAEVTEFYNSIPKDSLPFFSLEVEVGHIVMKPTVGEKAKAEAREKLEGIRQRVLSGEDFEELARIYSEDPGSKQFGGELGFFSRGQLVPEYEAASLKLKPGEMTGIVESVFGFHFIQMIERRGNKFNTRHILIKPKIHAEDLVRLEGKMDSIKSLIISDKLKFEKAAQQYSIDQGTKNNGGYFIDPATGSSRISLEKIDMDMYFVLEKISPGQISEPLVYKHDGEDARRIVFYKRKLKPHYANLKDDYQIIQNATLSQKKQRTLQEWFKKTKNQLEIEITEPKYSGCINFQ